jgi:hypothetical protein
MARRHHISIAQFAECIVQTRADLSHVILDDLIDVYEEAQRAIRRLTCKTTIRDEQPG